MTLCQRHVREGQRLRLSSLRDILTSLPSPKIRHVPCKYYHHHTATAVLLSSVKGPTSAAGETYDTTPLATHFQSGCGKRVLLGSAGNGCGSGSELPCLISSPIADFEPPLGCFHRTLPHALTESHLPRLLAMSMSLESINSTSSSRRQGYASVSLETFRHHRNLRNFFRTLHRGLFFRPRGSQLMYATLFESQVLRGRIMFNVLTVMCCLQSRIASFLVRLADSTNVDKIVAAR